MEQKSAGKWEAKVSASLTKATADQIWPLFKDFFNLHKWFPGMHTCYGIHGNNGEPGCVRYCAGMSISDDNDPDKPVNWAKERLIGVDDVERSLTYEFLESSMGFNSYSSTVKVIAGGGEGCVIEWGFTVDPVEGLTLDDMVRIYGVWLNAMAKNLEDYAIHQAV